MLNGADNEYYEPGETGNSYGIPGDAGLATPGPWMSPSPVPRPTMKEPTGSTLPPLEARWKIVNQMAADWLVVAVTADKRIAIVTKDKQITAIRTIDGRTLWQRSGFAMPALAQANLIIAKDGERGIVGLSVETGKTLWKTAWRPASILSFDVAGKYIIVAIDPGDYARRRHSSTISELCAKTGATLWTHQTDLAFPGTRHFSFLGTSIVASFSAFDEPSFGEVELLDRATGASLRRFHRARYEGAYGHQLWLRSTSTNTSDGAIVFLRCYSDGRRLEAYRYSSPSAGKPAEVQLSRQYVFIASGNRLNRYDRDAPPSEQIINRYGISGSLIAVIGESPLFASPFFATIYVPTSPHAYSGRRVIIDWSEQRHLVALSRTAAYVSANSLLFAITDRGAGFSSQGNCANPSSIAIVGEDDVIVSCGSALARYRLSHRSAPDGVNGISHKRVSVTRSSGKPGAARRTSQGSTRRLSEAGCNFKVIAPKAD